MKGGSGRTPGQIRREIRAERERLDASLASLASDARRSGRLAGAVLAALTSLLVVRRRRRR